MLLYCTVFSVNSNPREITNMLIRTCKLVKKCSFSTILISCQCKSQYCTLWKWIFCFLCMVLSPFTKSGMRNILLVTSRYWSMLFCLCISYIFYFYSFCVCQTQSKFITMYSKFYWVTHWCIFNHSNISLWNNTHIQQMLS